MKGFKQLAVALVACTLLVSCVETSAFGDSRHRYETRSARDVVRGTVERVDYRNDTLILRDYFTERNVRIDLRRGTARDFRRGDYVKFAGDWNTWSGIFYASQIEELRSRRR
jgi:hypothetical protein